MNIWTKTTCISLLLTGTALAGNDFCDVDATAACLRAEAEIQDHVANHPESSVTMVQQTKLIEFQPEHTGWYAGFGLGIANYDLDEGTNNYESYDFTAATLEQRPPCHANAPHGEECHGGTDGEDGADGEDGQDGTDGEDGQDGEDGADGSPGADGEDGEDGNDGADGKDGADAAGSDDDSSEIALRIFAGKDNLYALWSDKVFLGAELGYADLGTSFGADTKAIDLTGTVRAPIGSTDFAAIVRAGLAYTDGLDENTDVTWAAGATWTPDDGNFRMRLEYVHYNDVAKISTNDVDAVMLSGAWRM